MINKIKECWESKGGVSLIGITLVISWSFTMAPETTNLIFADFLKELGQEGHAIYWSSLFFIVAMSIGTIITTFFAKKYSSKISFFPLTLLVGWGVFFVPNFLLQYINNKVQWVFSHVFLGLGGGIMLTAINIAFYKHLEDKRIRDKVFNICHFFIGFSKPIFTYLVQGWLTSEGFRETACIMGYISMLGVLSSLMMLYTELYREAYNRLVLVRAERERECICCLRCTRCFFGVCDCMKEAEVSNPQSLDIDFSYASSRNRSRQNNNEQENQMESWCIRYLICIKNWCIRYLICIKNWLIKIRSFLKLCLGVSFMIYVDSYFFTILPLMVKQMGYTNSDAAISIIIHGAFEIVSRLLLVCCTDKADTKCLFFVATFVMLLTQIGAFITLHVYVIHSATNVLIIVFFGLTRSWIQVLSIRIILDNVRKEEQDLGYAIYSFIMCLIFVSIGYIVAYFRDKTDNFKIPQIILLVGNVVIIVWIVLQSCLDFKKRGTRREPYRNHHIETTV